MPQPPPPLRIPRGRHNFTTQIFWDSDVGKWIEAASYALSHRRDATIEAQIDEITEWLAEAQLPDGYLNCWYIGREVENRWTNLRDNHELYCAGHMLEGAIAYFLATGRRRLLDIMEKYVDHIATVFGPGPDQKHGYPGHQEIELALIKLYHLTKDRKRLDLAAYFINERGKAAPLFRRRGRRRAARGPNDFWQKTFEYNQSHKPVREQDKVVGHAVRAMYMYTAMADLAADLGDAALKHACEVLWEDVTARRMYVTAGLGPAAANEGFTTDYDLPNDTAYAETCASVALIFWAQRMLNLDLDGKYADVLELALYNGALSGLSRDGTHYFYENPLESDGRHTRWAWHPCPCCTMNVSRLVASVGGYFYSTGTDEIAIHLYGGSATSVEIGGRKVGIREESNYPWSGAIRVHVDPDSAERIHREAAHSRLGEASHGQGQWRGHRRRRWDQQRLSRHPPHLVERRHDRARPADAGDAHLRPSERQGRHRPGLPQARPLRLLRRDDRQSGCLDRACPPAAQQRGRSGRAQGPFRRHRHPRRQRQGGDRLGLERHALPLRPAPRTSPPPGPRSPTTSGPIADRQGWSCGSRRTSREAPKARRAGIAGIVGWAKRSVPTRTGPLAKRVRTVPRGHGADAPLPTLQRHLSRPASGRNDRTHPILPVPRSVTHGTANPTPVIPAKAGPQ